MYCTPLIIVMGSSNVVYFRYFLIEIVCTDFLEQTLLQLPFSSKDIQTKIMTAMEKIFGDYGAAVLRSGLNGL